MNGIILGSQKKNNSKLMITMKEYLNCLNIPNTPVQRFDESDEEFKNRIKIILSTL